MNFVMFSWRNGGRSLMLSGAAAILALTILGMSFLVVNFWPTEGPFAPLSVSDVEINTRVEGVVGPATYVGKSYKGTITICNNDNRTHTITFIIQWERLSGAVRFVSGGSIEFPMEPGCETLTGESAPLPVEVSSGLWRESTAAIVQRGDRKQTVSFVSEPFQVVPLD